MVTNNNSAVHLHTDLELLAQMLYFDYSVNSVNSGITCVLVMGALC